jgi:hypothetical protein
MGTRRTVLSGRQRPKLAARPSATLSLGGAVTGCESWNARLASIFGDDGPLPGDVELAESLSAEWVTNAS